MMAEAKLVEVNEDGDYRLDGTSVWIEVKGLVVYILDCGDTLAVEVLPNDGMVGAPIKQLSVDQP
jgi:hypothetical protein